MENVFDFADKIDIAWCPGCGNHGIRKELLAALRELHLGREKVVLVSGIGQAAKMPQYINTSFFNGLHGRGLPAATAIKACNPELTVIAVGGDGDMYGEGGNHFLHASRRNPDITLLVHDNMVYGLTKGQAAPTSRPGMETPVQVFGVFEKPLNPMALAIALDVTFVARVFCADVEQTKEVMKKAITHKGFALVDIFQPCVSFNKTNTFKWFKDNTVYLPDGYDPSDRAGAFKKSLEEEPFPLGIIYQSDQRVPFEDNLEVYKRDRTPLYRREVDMKKVAAEIMAKV
ncbi:MAG TPA: thiamine pyrophosphate-dependent enzyme [Candidatus Binatia bacterium]|nr:thiamine pyrophosphate-dependent enzyme [Candidatus Binatia bacterium]